MKKLYSLHSIVRSTRFGAMAVGALALAGLFFAADKGHSQQYGQGGAQQYAIEEVKSPEQVLAALVEANKALLEKQKATLQNVEALQKEVDQLRIFVKRG